MNSSVRKWSSEETILALELYCQLPFGKCDKSTQEVRDLANSLGRTPSSIAMKLVNFASLDPVHKARGVSGLKNTSKLDKQIWQQANNNWNEFYDDAIRIKSEKNIPLVSISSDKNIEGIEFDWESKSGQSVSSQSNRRIGQAFFRRMILSGYGNKCCICGIEQSELLVASHILPWSKYPKRRLDPRNGLCMMVLFDRAFDSGLMSISPKFEVRFDTQLTQYFDKEPYNIFFKSFEGKPINLPERWHPDPTLLSEHNTLFTNHK